MIVPETLINGKITDPMHDFSLFVNDSDGSFEELEVSSKDCEVLDNGTSSIVVLSKNELMCETYGKVIVACARLGIGGPEILLFVTGEEKNCNKLRVMANDLVIIIAGDELTINKEKLKTILKGVRKKMTAHRILKEVLENMKREKVMVIAAKIHEII